MGVEPTFSCSNTVWPLTGNPFLPPESADPAFAIPHGAIEHGSRDMLEQVYLVDKNSTLTSAPREPLDPAHAKTIERWPKWNMALAASCIFHIAAALAFAAYGANDILIEGANQAGTVRLGNSSENQLSAGEISPDSTDVTNVTLVSMLTPKPVETMTAQPVATVEALQPVNETAAETAAAETVEPVQATTIQTPQPPESVEPAPQEPASAVSTSPLPQILTATSLSPVEDNVVANSVEQPQSVQVAPTQSAVKAPPATSHSSKQAVETIEPVPDHGIAQLALEDIPHPTPRPPEATRVSAKKTASSGNKAKETKKVLRKPAGQKQKTASGANGANHADTKSGVSDGETRGTKAAKTAGGNNSAAGNAAVSNYPGKVAMKLRRAVRSISRAARAKAHNDVHVTFVVNAGGGVGAVSVARSSGSSELDRAALAVVRRAAPFPPIPAQAGRSSWKFTVPLGVR